MGTDSRKASLVMCMKGLSGRKEDRGPKVSRKPIEKTRSLSPSKKREKRTHAKLEFLPNVKKGRVTS